TTSILAAGSHPISAVYGGDGNCATSTSNTVNQVVNAVSTSTNLGSSVNPSTIGQAVTFTATVSCTGFPPTGTVSFFDGSTLLATATLSGGAALVTTSTLTAGSHPITAVYGGDGNCASSTS